MTHAEHVRNPGGDRQHATQGEAVATWLMWGLLLAAVLITYSRIDPHELYNVSRGGLGGGLSRSLVLTNYPIALVAVASMLVALDAAGSRWWWIGGPAIAACAVTAWPGVVDQGDLDARPVNAIPALGVLAALLLTVVASSRSTASWAPRQPFDPFRLGIAAVVLVASLPWIGSNLGFYLPEVVFITERAVTSSNGTVAPAVHLGDHHGFDGALLLLTALLLSRSRPSSPTLAAATTAYVSLMATYGAFNFVQDLWNEQIWKRGWSDWSIDSAVQPEVSLEWLSIVLTAVAVYVLLRCEARAAVATRGRRRERGIAAR